MWLTPFLVCPYDFHQQMAYCSYVAHGVHLECMPLVGIWGWKKSHHQVELGKKSAPHQIILAPLRSFNYIFFGDLTQLWLSVQLSFGQCQFIDGGGMRVWGISLSLPTRRGMLLYECTIYCVCGPADGVALECMTISGVMGTWKSQRQPIRLL